MQFKAIPGYSSIKQKILFLAQKDVLPHAQLYSGSSSSPYFAFALALATYLNCKNRSDIDSCGRCSGCQKIKKVIHPDIHFIFPTCSNHLQVNHHYFIKSWQKFLIENQYPSIVGWALALGANKQLIITKEEAEKIMYSTKIFPIESQYKIFIIWCPEYFHISTANALLKIFEEPPSHVLFFLVTHNAEKVLPTIISRTQRFNIPPFSQENIMQIFKSYPISRSQLRSYIFLSAQDIALIKHWMQEEQYFYDTFLFFRSWLRFCYKKDFAGLYNQVEKFATWDKEKQYDYFFFCICMMRHVFLAFFLEIDREYIPDYVYQFLQNFVKRFNSKKVVAIIHHLNKKYHHLERNAQPKILFLSLSMHIHNILHC